MLFLHYIACFGRYKAPKIALKRDLAKVPETMAELFASFSTGIPPGISRVGLRSLLLFLLGTRGNSVWERGIQKAVPAYPVSKVLCNAVTACSLDSNVARNRGKILERTADYSRDRPGLMGIPLRRYLEQRTWPIHQESLISRT